MPAAAGEGKGKGKGDARRQRNNKKAQQKAQPGPTEVKEDMPAKEEEEEEVVSSSNSPVVEPEQAAPAAADPVEATPEATALPAAEPESEAAKEEPAAPEELAEKPPTEAAATAEAEEAARDEFHEPEESKPAEAPEEALETPRNQEEESEKLKPSEEEQMETPEKTSASMVTAEEGDSDTSTTLARDDTIMTASSITANEQAAAEPEATGAVEAEAATGSVRIKVICDMTQPGDVVGIVGEDQALGSWDTAKMLTLSTSAADFPTWFVDVPCAAVTKDHKFVMLRADGGVTWEPIDGNRKLDGASPAGSATFGSWP